MFSVTAGWELPEGKNWKKSQDGRTRTSPPKGSIFVLTIIGHTQEEIMALAEDADAAARQMPGRPTIDARGHLIELVYRRSVVYDHFDNAHTFELREKVFEAFQKALANLS